jgi:solute carrier family 8 (sodium/calcium exchanger)
MGAIERITSKKKRLQDKANGRNMTVKVWNDTVANLTLMALGSSAPEILLSVIELISGNMFSGELGPATIVGSAAFNLFCISAVCVISIPEGELRYIKDTHVFAVTASCSVLAYVWLYFIVMISSENIVMLWEALLTFLMFPALVGVAYAADRGAFSSLGTRDEVSHQRVSLAEVSKEELAEIEVKILQKHGAETKERLSDHQLARLIEKEHAGPKSRAAYRVQAVRNMVGGRRVVNSIKGMGSMDSSKVEPIESVDLTRADDVTIEFCSATYAVIESVGTAVITVQRLGHLDCLCFVDYKSRDGTAMSGSDYTPVQGTLEFSAGEERKDIPVTIIDDTAYEDDEEFFVDLSNARCKDVNYSAVLGKKQTAKIAIVDDDEPGILRFEEDVLKVSEGLENKVVSVPVRRSNGSTGNISCQYATEDASALSGRDYEPTTGTLTLANGQTSAHVDVTIRPRGRYAFREEFRLILTDPTDGARFDPTTDGGDNSCICTIIIEADQTEVGRVDRVMQVLQADWDKAQIGHANWRDQFRDALFVHGGDEQEDGSASPLDWAMHILTVFWKVLFAIIPPADFCDGWACFIGALMMIAGVTALIGDLAALLGCVMDLPGSITAITFVALGTSLPDTFASKTAAEQDPYADASIGNITGSNSVNVFLGLGLPWTIGAIYWMTMDKDSSQAAEWAKRYPSIAKDITANDDLKFVVMGGDLGFSVAVFSICALVCIFILEWRRKFLGGELGGPQKAKYITAVLMVLLWLIYIILSSWKALSSDGCK